MISTKSWSMTLLLKKSTISTILFCPFTGYTTTKCPKDALSFKSKNPCPPDYGHRGFCADKMYLQVEIDNNFVWNASPKQKSLVIQF